MLLLPRGQSTLSSAYQQCANSFTRLLLMPLPFHYADHARLLGHVEHAIRMFEWAHSSRAKLFAFGQATAYRLTAADSTNKGTQSSPGPWSALAIIPYGIRQRMTTPIGKAKGFRHKPERMFDVRSMRGWGVPPSAGSPSPLGPIWTQSG
ncbi:hypothetical protein BJV78DRAFT_863323 [Lactifluus subvellereus]|nr:hypothetical protein BJV78DRAFT_863323 [Lactifluus subvellereus]